MKINRIQKVILVVFFALISATVIYTVALAQQFAPFTDTCVGGEVGAFECTYKIYLNQINNYAFPFQDGWGDAFPCQGVNCPPPPVGGQ